MVSYDAIVWFPILLVGASLGAALIAARRPLAGAVVAAVLALGFIAKVVFGLQFYGADARAIGSWADQHEAAYRIHQRALESLKILPFAAAPALLAVLGAAIAALRRRSPWPLSVGAVACLPTLIFLAWIVGDAVGLSPDDPQWVFGYLHEWRAAGSPPSNGGPCASYLQQRSQLRARGDDPAVDDAERDCRALCLHQAEVHRFNPGLLEQACLPLLAPGTETQR